MSAIDERFKRQRAVFLISCSPFQVMCMIEAIKAFELDDYKVLLCYDEKELPRKKQTLTLMEQYNIKYEIESFNYRITKSDRLKMIKPVYNGLKLAFIGDCCDELLIYKATRYVSNGGTLIYFDDGTATIQFFNGLFQMSDKLRPYYNLVCKLRNLDFDKYFFTIYKGLEDGKHICLDNKLTYFASQQMNKAEKKDIVLLGVYSGRFCEEEQIAPAIFVKKLREYIVQLKQKYPDERIVYVPHGKDTSQEPKQICEELDVVCQPSKISVEMLLLDAPNRPKAVYGFTSSALYNVKLLFPDTEVYNVTFTGNTPLNDRAENASRYYEEHGIVRVVLDINK